jgi:hypothetical protein
MSQVVVKERPDGSDTTVGHRATVAGWTGVRARHANLCPASIETVGRRRSGRRDDQ